MIVASLTGVYMGPRRDRTLATNLWRSRARAVAGRSV